MEFICVFRKALTTTPRTVSTTRRRRGKGKVCAEKQRDIFFFKQKTWQRWQVVILVFFLCFWVLCSHTCSLGSSLQIKNMLIRYQKRSTFLGNTYKMNFSLHLFHLKKKIFYLHYFENWVYIASEQRIIIQKLSFNSLHLTYKLLFSSFVCGLSLT